jgi:hypothetical protein
MTDDNQNIRIEVCVSVAKNTNLQQLKQKVADAIRTISNPVRTDPGILVLSNVKIITDTESD